MAIHKAALFETRSKMPSEWLKANPWPADPENILGLKKYKELADKKEAMLKARNAAGLLWIINHPWPQLPGAADENRFYKKLPASLEKYADNYGRQQSKETI
ncbi:hypothetical protein [Roseivirga thermotolerans]|uniref:Uncharacterized protein n=1 Tax=Roseivirga thermotolerans TaxID=1758176 RepID=A0ABQ3I518_9BACT|nr:hypothetical protein [Roseivirga thermotolerans]GHE65110.1 hypothetical protein GCM10011340_20200 [Roseivirga thermotolerans]